MQTSSSHPDPLTTVSSALLQLFLLASESEEVDSEGVIAISFTISHGKTGCRAMIAKISDRGFYDNAYYEGTDGCNGFVGNWAEWVDGSLAVTPRRVLW